jgi:hypothetical protein
VNAQFLPIVNAAARTVGGRCQQGERKAPGSANSRGGRGASERKAQDERICRISSSTIVIPAPTDGEEASHGVERKGRDVVYRDLEDDTFRTAETCINAYRIQKSRTDTFAPPFGQDPKRKDLTLFVQVSRQSEPGGRFVLPSDAAEKSDGVLSRRLPRNPMDPRGSTRDARAPRGRP